VAAGQPFDRIEAFQVAVAAGVAAAAPTSTDISFHPGDVVGIEIIVPPGHLGLTGIQLANAHTPIVPYTAGAFIIANDEKIEWALQSGANAGNWQAITYNTDVFPHDFYVRFLVLELARSAGSSLLPAPLVL
jgi:hypothetical protein